MWPVPVVMLNTLLGHLLQLENGLRRFRIQRLPLVVAEEALYPRIISSLALAVHADSNGFFALNTVNISL